MPPSFDFTTFPILTTERLILRQITPDDAAGMSAIFGDPLVLRYLNQRPLDTPEKGRELIDYLAGEYRQQVGVDWGITLPGDDRLIGMCGAYKWDRANRHIDIGYHMLPAHWGKGYATEAARAIIGWCFAALDVHRIQADCTEGNMGSERVLLKCGMTVEGIWREVCWEHGRFVNLKQFGLLQHEFKMP